MGSLKHIRLADATVQVGPALTRLDGFGEDIFSLEPASDVGSALGGVQGDGMFVSREQNVYVATFTFMQASDGVTLLLALHATKSPFKVNFAFGDFTLFGAGHMMNLGAWAASLGTLTRTMTMNVYKISGNTEVSIGADVSVG